MGRFESEILPKALVDAQSKRNKLEGEKWEVGRKIDSDEEFRGHECDCDRCESQFYNPLSRLEIEELESKFNELDEAINGLDKDIKAMTNYKAFAERAGLV